jgi:DUF2892 family protein
MTTKNMGGVDTAVRAVVGTVLMVWAALVADSQPFLALGAGFVATIILTTAIAGVCALYTLLGIDTRPRPLAQPPIAFPQQPAHQLR